MEIIKDSKKFPLLDKMIKKFHENVNDREFTNSYKNQSFPNRLFYIVKILDDLGYKQLSEELGQDLEEYFNSL